MFRRRANNKTSRVACAAHLNGSAGGEKDDTKATVAVAGALLDYSLMLFLVFGGCCSYVLTFQLRHPRISLTKAIIGMSGHTRSCCVQNPASVRYALHINEPHALPTTPYDGTPLVPVPPSDTIAGPALTFSQMLFIAAQQLPSFVTWDASSSPSSTRSRSWLPRLKPRQVPLAQWLLQVTTFASGSLLNNLVYAYSVPLTVQIVFRTAGKSACAFSYSLHSTSSSTSLPSFLFVIAPC